MRKEKQSALLADNCPLICETYKNIISKIARLNPNFNFNTDITYNCNGAYDIIKKTIEKETSLNFVVLDLKLSPAKSRKILSGEDLGLLIRKLLPNTKLIVSTDCNDNYRIHNIFKSLNPEGFLIKNDLTSKELKNAIKNVTSNIPYYSKTVLSLLRKEVSNNFSIDSIDRQILYELSLGSKMKDMPNFIPLSAASIEKRKRHLKKVFNVKAKGDRELILIAKEKGFI
ncbi:DNA-binding response regulator [Tenacibaculum sp. 1_MG-2023]|uniref:DNA-binding response regulator n=1 Tax=Tenacibaculum sp. 1_MG-2023 TaxID=3062653 RepID=UPI0026E2927A|nr:DNA-binding response regulator [Tenacibaculum sp. 1_MG-2023]MDO6675822.1 DNA-binding response regulator [Tenacibaculum sp. 1_MG-2023]